jgi:hypothetical protein
MSPVRTRSLAPKNPRSYFAPFTVGESENLVVRALREVRE